MTITVTRASPFVTVQDGGRAGFRAAGVPVAGAMDRVALELANILAGNDRRSAALEWAVAGGAIRFDGECAFALAGATVEAALDGEPVPQMRTMRAGAGATLEIRRITSGRFLYVAVGGGIEVEELLGSRSTYLPAHFGGLEGRLIRSGDTLATGEQRGAIPRAGFSVPAELRPDYALRRIRAIPGPQWDLFAESDRQSFFDAAWSVAHASDRMGYRLQGAPLAGRFGSLLSEAATRGAIQIPPDGLPIVLMADAPTVGGYPKIAVVADSDIGLLAQLPPGARFGFERVTVEAAQERLRLAESSMRRLADNRQRKFLLHSD